MAAWIHRRAHNSPASFSRRHQAVITIDQKLRSSFISDIAKESRHHSRPPIAPTSLGIHRSTGHLESTDAQILLPWSPPTMATTTEEQQVNDEISTSVERPTWRPATSPSITQRRSNSTALMTEIRREAAPAPTIGGKDEGDGTLINHRPP